MTVLDYKRFPSKKNALQMLRMLGVKFGCIFDVGVQGQTQELIEVFPDLKHYLFEPVQQYITTIQNNYAKIDHEIVNVAVSNRDGSGKLRLVRLASEHVTHSNVVESDVSPNGGDVVDVRLLCLSSLLSQRNFPEPILLKIDVDGHESAILEGLIGSENKIGAIIIEAEPKDFAERIQWLQNIGFIVWDFVDPCYYKGCLAQMDIVFISSTIAKKTGICPLETDKSFDWKSWQVFSDC